MDTLDDQAVEEAKRAVAGPLGENLAKFPLLFAKAVLFGQRPSRANPAEIRNGTITLVDLGTGPLGITCQHVVESYRRLRIEASRPVFQIGNVELDPVRQLVDENERLDLAVIRLTGEQAGAITSEGEIGSCFFRPKAWPCQPPEQGLFVAFGGFPGKLKEVISFDELEFRSWSSGASEISSVSDHQFISAFDRDYWVGSYGNRVNLNLTALGGMSGGPAFVSRGLYWDLVGIVSEYHENFDAVIFSSTSRVQADGTIEPSAI